jgi:hypothetical protein
MYYPMTLVHWEDARATEKMGFPPTPDPDHPEEIIDGGYNAMKAYVEVVMGRLIDGLEDPGRMWDCDTITAGNAKEDPANYNREVKGSDDPEVMAAMEHFMVILNRYEVPEGIPRTWHERREYQLKQLQE